MFLLGSSYTPSVMGKTKQATGQLPLSWFRLLLRPLNGLCRFFSHKSICSVFLSAISITVMLKNPTMATQAGPFNPALWCCTVGAKPTLELLLQMGFSFSSILYAPTFAYLHLSFCLMRMPYRTGRQSLKNSQDRKT